jgi:hypothetical protein
MPSITEEMIETVAAKKQADAIGKILLAHAREISKLFEMQGRRTNIEFMTAQALKQERKP